MNHIRFKKIFIYGTRGKPDYTKKKKKTFSRVKVTANLFGLEFCKILKSYYKIAHYIYFVLKKKLFENGFFLAGLLQILCFA